MVYSPFPGFTDRVEVRVAETPVGPFTDPVTVVLPGCHDTTGGVEYLCYAGTAQPSLSEPGLLGIGYYDQLVTPSPEARSVHGGHRCFHGGAHREPLTTGRFAPSPTGDLHLGNLRTAVLAWCLAKREGGRFVVRMEDLTTESAARFEQRQLADLEALGIRSDDVILRSSERLEVYRSAIAGLTAAGLTYPCFCSRREIREAVDAPHGAGSAMPYPGTCADLDAARIAERMAAGEAAGSTAACRRGHRRRPRRTGRATECPGRRLRDPARRWVSRLQPRSGDRRRRTGRRPGGARRGPVRHDTSPGVVGPPAGGAGPPLHARANGAGCRRRTALEATRCRHPRRSLSAGSDRGGSWACSRPRWACRSSETNRRSRTSANTSIRPVSRGVPGCPTSPRCDGLGFASV
ncbi:MAG: glutamate--tRNA ligase family protein [Microthrixaceae bacterium]|nr:glutamate--tRNA ligase family protein [Microthrixaceae bacterium]